VLPTTRRLAGLGNACRLGRAGASNPCEHVKIGCSYGARMAAFMAVRSETDLRVRGQWR
jgi:hypothetical protein